ncbi:MAG: DUF3307 domain-containing protein [Anaerolineae bacterium]
MSILLRLLLGHMVGDYVFQPFWLVVQKHRGLTGLFLHVGIVVAATALLLGRDLFHWWPWLLLLGALHVLQDQGKISLGRDWQGKGLYLFLVDQGIHVATIIILSVVSGAWYFGDLGFLWQGTEVFLNRLIVYLITAIFIIWTVPILEEQAAKTLHPYSNTGNQGEGETIEISGQERAIGAIERLAGVALGLSPYPYFMPLAFLPRLYLARTQFYRSSINISFATKVATSFAGSVTAVLLLRLFPLL